MGTVKKIFKIERSGLLIIALNIILILSTLFAVNEYFIKHSWVFYGIQSILLIPYIIHKTRYVKDLFLPSTFVLFYYLVNQILGSIVVPSGYGIDKQFTPDIHLVNSYKVIVPYFLIINLCLFILSSCFLKYLNEKHNAIFPIKADSRFYPGTIADNLISILLLIIFVSISYFKIYMAFAFQLAIMVIICSRDSNSRKWISYISYVISLSFMVLLNYDNKREIIIIFFLIIFFESYHNRWKLRFTIRKLLLYTAIGTVFLGLILASSIFRGYGNFNPKSLTDAVKYVPEYIKSDVFIDSFTENLELNYCYGTAITSMDMILNGKLKYKFGLTLLKVFFIPVPREFISWKPYSMMQIYTKNRNPEYFNSGGSYPVIFQCDMFLNFHFLGIIPFFLIFYFINSLYLKFHEISKHNLQYFSYPFLFITILVFARGSGLELYVIHYLYGLLFFVIYTLLLNYLYHLKHLN